jgi:hypothetical protein
MATARDDPQRGERMHFVLPGRYVVKKLFGLMLLAGLLSLGTLSIAGDSATSQRNCDSTCQPCPGPCPVPCGMCG